MPELFSFQQGDSPVLLSSPHDGSAFPPGLSEQFAPLALENQDRDWFVTELYSFIENTDISYIKANYSRYVVDLNRSNTGEVLYPGKTETGICPLATFSGEPLYQSQRTPTAEDIDARIKDYWLPYHRHIENELQRLKAIHGYALLWDAHSIKAEVSNLFTGVLPGLNFGTNSGEACHPDIARSLVDLSEKQSDYQLALDGRFKGGFITRHYGKPEEKVHAVQLEINQSIYLQDSPEPGMDKNKQEKLSALLKELLACFKTRAEEHFHQGISAPAPD